MDKVRVAIAIVLLDALAGLLAMQAQAVETKAKQVSVIFFFIQCKEAANKAYQLALASALLLLVTHIMANCFFGRGCACILLLPPRLESFSLRASIARKLAVSSWITFIAALSLLLAGAMSNTKSKTSCGFFIHFDFHTLALGGNLCFVHGLVTVAYCITATAAEQHMSLRSLLAAIEEHRSFGLD